MIYVRKASFTGAIATTTLTTSAVTGTIVGGMEIVTGATAGTAIVRQISGTTGGADSYEVSISQTVGSSTMNAAGVALKA